MKKWRHEILNFEKTHPHRRLISARRLFNNRLRAGQNVCRVEYSQKEETITFTDQCTLPAKIFNPSPSPLLMDDVLTDDKENRPTDDVDKIMKKRRARKAWEKLVSAKVSKVTDQKIANILEKGLRRRQQRAARQAKPEPPYDPFRDDILGIGESVQGEKEKPNYEESRKELLQRTMANRRLAMGLQLAGGQQSADDMKEKRKST